MRDVGRMSSRWHVLRLRTRLTIHPHFRVVPVFLIHIEKGFELFCDLCLADCLATGGTVSRVVIQLKGHPTFVSDAMAKDMLAMIDLLADLDASEYPRYARRAALNLPASCLS